MLNRYIYIYNFRAFLYLNFSCLLSSFYLNLVSLLFLSIPSFSALCVFVRLFVCVSLCLGMFVSLSSCRSVAALWTVCSCLYKNICWKVYLKIPGSVRNYLPAVSIWTEIKKISWIRMTTKPTIKWRLNRNMRSMFIKHKVTRVYPVHRKQDQELNWNEKILSTHSHKKSC